MCRMVIIYFLQLFFKKINSSLQIYSLFIKINEKIRVSRPNWLNNTWHWGTQVAFSLYRTGFDNERISRFGEGGNERGTLDKYSLRGNNSAIYGFRNTSRYCERRRPGLIISLLDNISLLDVITYNYIIILTSFSRCNGQREIYSRSKQPIIFFIHVSQNI